MNSVRLAYSNMKNNLRVYWLHLIALTFSVMTYYQFVAMKYNPEVLSITEIRDVRGLSQATSIVLFVFIVFFSWFSSSFFLQQRKKEIGLYTLMGITNYKIGWIYGIENFLLNLTAIVAGCSLGSLLGKVFIMIVAKYCNLGVSIDFFISYNGLKETILTFLILALLTSLKGYIEIIRSSLIELIHASKKEEEMPKANVLSGILGVLLIGLGYYLSTLALERDFFTYLLLTVFVIIFGTYMLFRSTSTLILKMLINNKKILYKGINIITISNLCYRIRSNYKVYAMLAIILTSTITSFATVASLNYSNSSMEEIDFPFSFFYISTDLNDEKKVNQIIQDEGINVVFQNEIEQIVFEDITIEGSYYKAIAVVKYSDYKEVIQNLQYKFMEDVLIDKPLQDYEGILNRKASSLIAMGDKSEIHLNKENIQIRRSIKAPLFGKGWPADTILVNDPTYKSLSNNRPKYYYHGIKVADESELTDEIINRLKETIPIVSEKARYSYIHFSEENKGNDKTDLLVKMTYILGAFLALVLIMAAGGIIYFKVISDATDDKEKFRILVKIGMTEEEIKKTVGVQIGVSFIGPLFVGTIHSLVALKVLEEMLGIMLMPPIVVSIIIITFIFFLYYLITHKKYMELVKGL